MKLFLFCFAVSFAPLALAQDALMGPCRSWLFPCGPSNVCTTVEDRWRSQYDLFPGCPSILNATAPPPPGDCLISEGTCQFVSSPVECTTWLDTCQHSYQCGTVQEFETFSQNDGFCSNFNLAPPLPDSLCVPINNTCQWYNPCRSWRGFCYSPYICGTEDQYWAFIVGPQPICAPPPNGWVEPVPPGDCIVQNDTCRWSDCTAWLDACQLSWICGSDHERQAYQALPPPACPFPGDDYVPPSQPHPCTFNQMQGQCQFEPCVNGMVFNSCGSACPLTCNNINSTNGGCIELCTPGCFCPSGTVQLGSTCVQPSDCPCASVSCATGFTCQVYEPTNETYCQPSCSNNNGGCDDDQFCQLMTVQCFRAPCPPIVQCSDTDPCAATTCLYGSVCRVDEPTGVAYCEPTCDVDNGGCGIGQICSLVDTQCFTSPCPRSVECSCPEGKEYQACASLCPPTCDNPNPGFTCLACGPGCACPQGTVVLGDSCVAPSDCPQSPCASVSCATGSTCQVYAPTNETYCQPSCSIDNGGCDDDQFCQLMTVQCIRAPCPPEVECSDYHPCAAYDCAYGYVCTVDGFTGQPYCNPTCDVPFHCGDEQSCSLVSVNCSSSQAPCPQQVVCTDFNDCALIFCARGSECLIDPVTRQGYCQPSCSLDNGGCLPHERCQLTEVQCFTTPCPPIVECSDPCGLVLCRQYHYCELSSVTGNAVCVPSCEQDNGGCRSDQLCNIEEFECFPVDGAPCDPHRYIQCKNSPYIPCRSDAPDCPPNSRCLTQNTTGQSICLESCYRRNGGCDDDEVCITEVVDGDCPYREECATDIICLDLDDLGSRCPAGKEHTECGTACPETCETYVAQEDRVCTAQCVIGCFCPGGLVVYRDRCVDPRECYTLLQDPPQPNPLPIDSNVVLLELQVSELSLEEFVSATQDELTASVERLLEQEGYSSVTVTVHAVYQDQQLLIVLRVTGSNVAYSKAGEIADIVLANQGDIPFSVERVTAVDAPLLASSSLSTGAIVGIVLAGLALLLAVGAVVGVVFCLLSKGRPKGSVRKVPAEPNPYGEITAKQSATVVYSKLEAAAADVDVEKLPLGSD